MRPSPTIELIGRKNQIDKNHRKTMRTCLLAFAWCLTWGGIQAYELIKDGTAWGSLVSVGLMGLATIMNIFVWITLRRSYKRQIRDVFKMYEFGEQWKWMETNDGDAAD